MPEEYDIKDEPRESQEDGGEEEVRTAFIPKYTARCAFRRNHSWCSLM